MMSFIFDGLNGEKIMLPIHNTVFREYSNTDFTYVQAIVDGKLYDLRTTLQEIQRISKCALDPVYYPAREFKDSLGG